MPAELTDLTEIVTGLGTLRPDLAQALAERPVELTNVDDAAWDRLVGLHRDGRYPAEFAAAFANGQALLAAPDGLRGRPPRIVEWKGPQKPPGDDAIPADLRIDHVYLVSCKYQSKVLLNPGPARLFERLLVGESRSTTNWFAAVAPGPYQALYETALTLPDLADLRADLPGLAANLDAATGSRIAKAFPKRPPEAYQAAWETLCEVVATESARRWTQALGGSRTQQLRLLWRLLRISSASYFVLGADRSGAVQRLRIGAAWDWHQHFELRSFAVAARPAGQPVVAWEARARVRSTGEVRSVAGHVEVRWSHGRFGGMPEAKVYLDTPHELVPGYFALDGELPTTATTTEVPAVHDAPAPMGADDAGSSTRHDTGPMTGTGPTTDTELVSDVGTATDEQLPLTDW